MESVQPLLTLCASHWKAEHVLGNTLLVKVATNSESDESDSPAELANKSPGSNNKKRPAKRHSRDKKRRKKSNGMPPPAIEGSGAKSIDGDIGKSRSLYYHSH